MELHRLSFSTQCSLIYLILIPNAQNWFTAPGYAEGSAGSYSAAFATEGILGSEIVYDFATMERAYFTFEGEPLFKNDFIQSKSGLSTSIVEATYMEYAINLNGFHSGKNLDDQYSGRFVGYTVGYGPSFGPNSGVLEAGPGGVGVIVVSSPEIGGSGLYRVVGPGISPSSIALSVAATNYRLKGRTYRYIERSGGSWRVTEEQIQQMKNDIRAGVGSPWGILHNSGEIIKEREEAARNLEQIWQTHQTYYVFDYDYYKKHEIEQAAN